MVGGRRRIKIKIGRGLDWRWVNRTLRDFLVVSVFRLPCLGFSPGVRHVRHGSYCWRLEGMGVDELECFVSQN